MKPPSTGIIERIKAAPNIQEVYRLLSELSTYKDASRQTVRRAQDAAEKVLNKI